jgi:broad specificity phosphatase PhoE
MARVLVVGHGATVQAREMIFGDQSELSRPVGRLERRLTRWVCGPEPACRATIAGLGRGEETVVDGLAGCDFGRWQGRSLAEVGETDPTGVQRWTCDPDARPHDGETLSELVARIGSQLAETDWPAGGSVAVVTPLVARAAAVWALQADPAVIFRIDVGPLGTVGMSGSGSSWRLQELTRSLEPALLSSG